MSFIALHRSSHTSLATDRPFLGADEISACESATALLQRLEQLLATRQAQVDTARDAARDAGFAEGRDAALREVAPALLQAWQHAAEVAFLEARSVRSAVIELALQVVQRVTTELAPPDVLTALVQRAAEALLPDQPVVVRVHPELAAAARERVSAAGAIEGGGAPARLDVRADASLGPLDCEFDTPTGQLLASLATQLAQVGAALHAANTRDAAGARR